MAAMTDFNPEARNRLDTVLNAFKVDQATRDLVWSRVSSASFSPSDPMAIVIAIETMFEHRGADIVAALNDLPKLVEAASRQAVGPVADKAVANVEGRIAEREATGSADFKRLVGAAVSKIDTHLQKASDAAELRLYERTLSIERREVLETIGKMGAMAAIAAILVVAVLTFGVATWSYNAGRAETVEAANELGALASRPDAATILRYSENNDMNDATAAWCGTGSTNVVVVQGARKCGPFWYDRPPVAGESSTDIMSIWNLVNAPFQRFPPLLLLAAGAALVGAVSYLRSRKA